MAVSKTHVFDEPTKRMAETFKALGHPARVEIMRLLIERGTCICGDIVDELPLAQSTVSQHLKALKQAGLIQGTIEGPAVCYCADTEAVSRVTDLLGSLLADRCCTPAEINYQKERTTQ